jgi:hypothetical protein
MRQVSIDSESNLARLEPPKFLPLDGSKEADITGSDAEPANDITPLAPLTQAKFEG